jgi:8-oxo-dGTP pyrophosphatase MutT (NUDIX family)
VTRPESLLHADAVRVLDELEVHEAGQEQLRLAYLEHLRAHPDGLCRDCHPDHVTASALVIDATGERVLLTLHRKLGRWLQTGGHCEAGDGSLRAAAHREATEESGIGGLVVAPRPLRLDRHPVPCGPLRPAHHLDVQYLALAPTDAQEQMSTESTALGWFGLDALPEPTDDSVRSLVSQARRRLGQPASPFQDRPAASDTPSR